MTELKLDLKKAALVVIDIQKGILAIDRKLEPYTANQVVANVSKLVRGSESLECRSFWFM